MSNNFTVRRTSILHESTVKQADTIKAKRRRTVAIRQATKHQRVNSRLTIIKVHPAVWRMAMKLADGNIKRIQVISDTECIVT